MKKSIFKFYSGYLTLIFSLLLVMSQLSIAQSITSIHFRNSDELIQVGSFTQYLLDSTGSLSIDEVQKKFHSDQFKTQDSDIGNFNASDSVVWFAMQVDFDSNETPYLNFGNNFIVNTAHFYASDSNGRYYQYYDYNRNGPINLTDIKLPYSSLAIPLIHLNNKRANTYFFRLSGQTHRNYIFSVGPLFPMLNHLKKHEISSIIFISFMMSIFIYNSFLFFSTRDKVYLPYLAYILYIAIALPFTNGFTFIKNEWLWNNSIVWGSIGYITTTIFTLWYLELKTTAPKFRIWIIFLTVIMGGLYPLLHLLQIVDQAGLATPNFLVSYIYNISIFISGIYVWVKGYKNARFYVLGWAFPTVSMMLFLSAMMGFIPNSSFIENIVATGFAMEAVLFAFALGDRLNTLEKEKLSIQEQHIGFIQEQNKKLAEQAYINSHLLRSPLCRVMGLVNLMKKEGLNHEASELLQLIEDSTHEMDELTIHISQMLEHNGYYNQYQEDFELIQKRIQKDLSNPKFQQ